jgi:hypothetical protein
MGPHIAVVKDRTGYVLHTFRQNFHASCDVPKASGSERESPNAARLNQLQHSGVYPTIKTSQTSLTPPFGLVDWLWCGETDVSELRPLQAYCSPPGDCDVDRGMMVSIEANSQLVYQSALPATSTLAVLWAETSLERVGE